MYFLISKILRNFKKEIYFSNKIILKILLFESITSIANYK
jgi:hypothetical protein